MFDNLSASPPTDNSGDNVYAPPAIVASVEAGIGGHFTGVMRWQMTDNVRVAFKGQQAAHQGRADAYVEWARDRVNVRLTGRVDSYTRCAKCSLDTAVRLGGRWSIGNQLRFRANALGYPVYKVFAVAGFTNVLRYDGDRCSVAAAVDQKFGVSLLYQRRVNDRLTVGVEMTGSTPASNRSPKTTWIHRLALSDGIVLRGQLDTDGNVIGHLSKTYLSNFTVGVSALLNHKSDYTGIGFEVRFGEKSPLNEPLLNH